MKKILVVLTGGTIGSRAVHGVRDVDGASQYLLTRRFTESYPEYFGRGGCEFEIISPYAVLSENLSLGCWEKLYSALNRAAQGGDFAGIVVAHGSDTLAYTSAIMAMLLRQTPCPIVFTASDRPVDDPLSNALGNFKAAVDFILNGGLRGVFVSYRTYPAPLLEEFFPMQGRQLIHLASRLRSADCCTDEFSSYGGVPFGEMTGGEFRAFGFPNPTAAELEQQRAPIAPDEIHLTRRVLLLHSYPDLDYAAVNPDGFAAVLNCGYHSATACCEGETTSLLRLAERCHDCGAELWLGSFKSCEGEMYASSRQLLDCGIKPFLDMSWEAAYAKALLAYNLPEVDADVFMARDVCFERVCAEGGI